MGKKQQQAPAVPDPTIAINAQKKANIDTANATAVLDHSNQYTPWGSSEWTQTPGEIKFDEAGYNAAMANYTANQENKKKSGRGGMLNALLFDTSGNPGGAFLDAYGQSHSSDVAPTKEMFTGPGASSWSNKVTLSPEQQALLEADNQTSQSMADLGLNQIKNVQNTINTPLDFSGLQKYDGQVRDVSPIADRIDTNWIGNMQGDINTGNVGQFRNKAGYGNIQDKLDISKVPEMVGGDDLTALMSKAQQASYNQQKGYLDPQWDQQRHDLENQLTQQGVMQNSDAWNRAIDDHSRNRTFAYQNANDNSVAQGLNAEAQLYGQGLSSNQNAFSQAIGSGNFANSAQAQGFGQDMSNAELNNRVVNDQFNQAQQQAQFHNQTVNDRFAQEQAKQQAINAAQNQTFNQMNVRENNNLTARNQGINEILQLQQNPLNVLNSLRTGAQVNAPTFGPTPQGNVANYDVMGQYNNQFANQMGEYNASVSQNNANKAGMVSLAGSLLKSKGAQSAIAAGAMAF